MDPSTPNAQRLQAWHAFGLGSTPFAHHYLGHLFRFLFLRLLRCFTSPGRRPRKGRMDCSMQVSPFRYPRIKGCLLLPAAFRSWLRLSSASGAKAFPACPLYLNLINPLLTFLFEPFEFSRFASFLGSRFRFFRSELRYFVKFLHLDSDLRIRWRC